METAGHDTAEIDDDLPGDLTIGTIADDNSTLSFGDTYDDQRLYLDTVVDMRTIANVVMRGQRAQTDSTHVRKTVPEAYAKKPGPLNTEDLIRAGTRPPMPHAPRYRWDARF